MLKRFFAAVCLAMALPTLAAAGAKWNGYYLGGALDYTSEHKSTFGSPFTYDQAGNKTIAYDLEGVRLTAFGGRNWRNGNVVWGAEVSLTFRSIGHDLVFNRDADIDQAEIDFSGDIVGRIGVVANETLFYARGGLAFARITNLGGDVDARVFDLQDAYISKKLRYGPTVGIGMERYFQENWLFRVEASVADYGSFRQANRQGVPGSQFYIVDNGPVKSIKIGVLHQF